MAIAVQLFKKITKDYSKNYTHIFGRASLP